MQTVGRYSNQNMPEHNLADKLSFKQKLAIGGLALFCILFSVIVFAPAVWLSSFLQSETGGRLVLNDAEGSLWNGSAYIGVAVDNNRNSEIAPLLPGRFSWHISPILLLGQIELVVENTETLQQPLYVTGNFRHIQISPNKLMLAANRLAGLGAPLNTIRPSGQMILSWDALGITFNNNLDVNGRVRLTLQDMASALSRVKPLGTYEMTFNWHGSAADVDLKTVQGPMLLSGQGRILGGRLQFKGQAQAEAEQEENLANLLNLLGQRRRVAGKNVISLEFK